MKFLSSFTLTALLATVASAQRAVIGFPADGATVAAGSNTTVEIDRPNSLSGSTEVAVVVGLQPCIDGPCRAPSDGLWTVLYNGGFNPQFHPEAPPFKPPHQNFTILIPANTPKGQAQLGVAHVTLIGAGLAPFLETMNITLNIV